MDLVNLYIKKLLHACVYMYQILLVSLPSKENIVVHIYVYNILCASSVFAVGGEVRPRK